MSFIPNNADAYNLGLADGTRFQAVPDATDFDIIAAGTSLAGAVSTGCAVTAQGTPNNTVAVAAGVAIVNGVNINVAAGNVTMTAADVSGNRRDLVVVNNAGTKSWVAGTAAASGTVPVKPAIPANSVVLAEVLVPANDNVIDSTQIVDKRQISQVGGRVLGSASITANLTGLTSTTAADVSGLATSVVVGGRPIVVRLEMPFFQKITAAGYVSFRINEGATLLQSGLVGIGTAGAATSWGNMVIETPPLTPSVGSHTYKAQYLVSTAGVDIWADPTFPSIISVVEV